MRRAKHCAVSIAQVPTFVFRWEEDGAVWEMFDHVCACHFSVGGEVGDA